MSKFILDQNKLSFWYSLGKKMSNLDVYFDKKYETCLLGLSKDLSEELHLLWQQDLNLGLVQYSRGKSVPNWGWSNIQAMISIPYKIVYYSDEFYTILVMWPSLDLNSRLNCQGFRFEYLTGNSPVFRWISYLGVCYLDPHCSYNCHSARISAPGDKWLLIGQGTTPPA